MNSPLASLSPPPFVRLRVELEATTSLTLRGWLGSTLHGAIGHALRRHDRADSFDASPSYRRWMETDHPPLPAWVATGRIAPLVLRPPPVVAEQRHLPKGERLVTELVCLHRDPASIGALCEALCGLSERGFGAKEQFVRVGSIRSAGRELLQNGRVVEMPVVERVETDSEVARELVLEARSPLVLRREGQLVAEPDPIDLALAALRRVISLRFAFDAAIEEFHLGDFADALTREIEPAHAEWHHFRSERWSSRQGKAHQVDGVLGTATFHGEVTPLAQLLTRAEPFGIGKGTALGLGSFVVAAVDKTS